MVTDALNSIRRNREMFRCVLRIAIHHDSGIGIDLLQKPGPIDATGLAKTSGSKAVGADVRGRGLLGVWAAETRVITNNAM